MTPSCNIQERENLLGGERCQEPMSVGEKGMGRLNEVGDGGETGFLTKWDIRGRKNVTDNSSYQSQHSHLGVIGHRLSVFSWRMLCSRTNTLH